MSSEKIFKILITNPEVPQEALDLLSTHCELIICEDVPASSTELLQKVKGVHAIFWAIRDRLDAKILDAAGPQLKAVSTMSAGINNIDVDELKKRKIPLGHSPIVANDAVADTAVGLMIAAARRFHEGRLKIETSTWENYHVNWMWGQEIRDSTVGFYGFGGIAKTIAKRLKGFEIGRVLYTQRRRADSETEKEYSASKVPFDQLLKESDFLFIGAPLTDETRGVFNATAFAQMKNTSVLVNIGRGAIVNQKDLVTALKTNQIFAAGLDVVDPEPLPATDPLLTLPNVVIVPHIGSATGRTRTEMATICSHNILRGLAGEPMFSPAY